MKAYLRFRSLWLAKAILIGILASTGGGAVAAGYQRLTVPATEKEPAIKIIVWTPCASASASTTLGPFVIPATENCPVLGSSLPLVVISHGQGGSPLGHYDTATALANAGFTVVSLKHPGDSFDDDSASGELKVFESRPRDVSRIITYMLALWQQRQRLAPDAVGVFGFSRGGYTALALGGATPSITASADRFCSSWWSFTISLCRQLKTSATQLMPQADPRVRAIVVVDPLNLFDAAGIKQIRVPIQLWASENGGDGVALTHVEAIRAALPVSTQYRIAKGAGHFAYLAPCSPALKDEAPKLCDDPNGFDRAAWHRDMNLNVVRFFNEHLR